MRASILLFCLIVLPACATRYSYNCNEYCATEGMVCTGLSTGSINAVSTGYESPTTQITGNTSTFSCRVPTNSEESSKVMLHKQSAAETAEKDHSAKIRNTWYWISGIAAVVGLSFLSP